MRLVFVVLMTIHGLIHLIGVVKAFGIADVPQLTRPISPAFGVVWLLAALLTLAAMVALFVAPAWWWLIGAVALVVSQVAIVSSFADAKFGTLANVILLLGVIYGFATQGPTSFRADLARHASAGLARVAALPSPGLISEDDLAPLPPPVQRYLRVTGFVGQPRILSYRVTFSGRIRSDASAAWMPFEAEQQSFADEPTRLFLMSATMSGVPVQAFHRFVGAAATMDVKVAGLIDMVHASGEVMNRSETVTLFNDMCILAPGTLISPAIRWEAVDDHTANARFTLGEQTIAAVLHFDDDGQLIDFVSDDRSRAAPDGKSFASMRFSTPVRDYRAYGPFRLAAHGDARWHAPAPEGEFVYGEFETLSVAYNNEDASR